MIHIEPKHLPFALCLLPYLGVGIALPVTIQDWFQGRMLLKDGMCLFVGLAIICAFEWAILLSIKSKMRQGQPRLLGRELISWYWAPPITFITGITCGLIFF